MLSSRNPVVRQILKLAQVTLGGRSIQDVEHTGSLYLGTYRPLTYGRNYRFVNFGSTPMLYTDDDLPRDNQGYVTLDADTAMVCPRSDRSIEIYASLDAMRVIRAWRPPQMPDVSAVDRAFLSTLAGIKTTRFRQSEIACLGIPLSDLQRLTAAGLMQARGTSYLLTSLGLIAAEST